MKRDRDTSWERSARWYDDLLAGENTYQKKVIAPNLTRVLELKAHERVLDLACGQGFFARQFAPLARTLDGCDLSKSLIAFAKREAPGNTSFHTASAERLSFAKDGAFDVVYCVLALQNLEKLPQTMHEVHRVLSDTGRFVFVLNHPAFRIPKRSSWGFDEEKKVQFRRVDGYLTPRRERIDMTPGASEGKVYTLSFHRSLQDYVKVLRTAGFCLTRLEEWISHRTSEQGPRAQAEDRARREIPLFLCVEARPLSITKKQGTIQKYQKSN